MSPNRSRGRAPKASLRYLLGAPNASLRYPHRVRCMLTIVDLGLGNLHSVRGAFERLGVPVRVSDDATEVASAERLVVPGQGGFAVGAAALRSDLGQALRQALQRSVPFLGICLGMQLLFEGSEEAPEAAGLGWFSGQVKRFPNSLHEPGSGERLKVPHMGWNQVRSHHALMPNDAWFYFVHSYHCVPTNRATVAATTTHGVDFCAAVVQGHVFATQFHPEKSHHAGQRLLRSFLAWS